MDIDEIMDIQDEMMEQKYEMDYINEQMNRNYAIDVDEDEIDKELQDLEDEVFMDVKLLYFEY